MKSKMFIAVLAACAGICGQTYGAVKDDEPKKRSWIPPDLCSPM